MNKLICQDCKQKFNSELTGTDCPKCKTGFAITIKEYEAVQRVRGIFAQMGR